MNGKKERIGIIGVGRMEQPMVKHMLKHGYAVTAYNSGRNVPMRLAHFFCEQYYRAQAAQLLRDNSCPLELSQEQIGEATAGLGRVGTLTRIAGISIGLKREIPTAHRVGCKSDELPAHHEDQVF
jgi:hypothetical protein